MADEKEVNGTPQPAPATPEVFKAAIPGPVVKVAAPQPPKAKAETPSPSPSKAPEPVHLAITGDNRNPTPTPDVPTTAKQPRREYVHAPDGDAAPCGGGGTLSPAFAEKIRDNPNAFGALQCSVCGLRPVSRYDADGERFQFLWKGTSDPVGKQYAE